MLSLAESVAISDNREVITLTEPQTWAALGILAAAFVGMITVTTQFMMRSITQIGSGLTTQMDGLRREIGTDIGSLRTEMVLRFEQVDRQFEQVDRRFEQVDRRFEQVDQRFEQVDRRFEQMDERFDRLQKQVDGLDDDVQAISKRVFPE